MTRYVVDFDREFDRLLDNLSRSKSPASTKSDAIRRAVALYSYLHDQVDDNPQAKVAIVTLDESRTVKEVLVLIDPLP